MTEIEPLDAAGNALRSEDVELWRKVIDTLATIGLRIYVVYEPEGIHLTARRDPSFP